MDELITKVEQWAKDKGLDQADPKAQFLKVAEEFGEILRRWQEVMMSYLKIA